MAMAMMGLRLPAELLAQVQEAAGYRDASAWIRQAIQERLDRLEMDQRGRAQ